MAKFLTATKEDIQNLVSFREGEVKLGEKVQVIGDGGSLKDNSAKFVMIGIPEDVGVRANGGVGGAHTIWPLALKALLNVQDTNMLHGEEILVLGAFDFTEEINASETMDVAELRSIVSTIDDAVFPVIRQIAEAGKIPIVIGGGHNNAYPILKGVSLAINKPLNCINLDAHSDYRRMEGRHSGNGFRYAHREGYLCKYEVVGLHENYNAQDILDELKDDPDLHFSFYEDIFIREKLSYYEAVRNAIDRAYGKPTGIEIDLDCIENVLSSAMTPCGISTVHARQYISWCARSLHPAYLHIAEGAATLRDGRVSATNAKLIAYLVTDFIKTHQNRDRHK